MRPCEAFTEVGAQLSGPSLVAESGCIECTASCSHRTDLQSSAPFAFACPLLTSLAHTEQSGHHGRGCGDAEATTLLPEGKYRASHESRTKQGCSRRALILVGFVPYTLVYSPFEAIFNWTTSMQRKGVNSTIRPEGVEENCFAWGRYYFHSLLARRPVASHV